MYMGNDVHSDTAGLSVYFTIKNISTFLFLLFYYGR
ncbi:uncharacterized protein METZ01_LOCUS413377 [marine metagenome]|uniref:Uncharacterized protein n=1 Tax=marine metagenome TaxID=408172 RepID=A0A382WP40_9ZZZZ